MDDGALLLHRLPMGSGGHWQNRKLHFSFAGFTRSLSNRRPACVLAAPRDRTRVECVAVCVELLRHRLEHHFFALDIGWHACSECCIRGFCSWISVGCKFVVVSFT